MPFWTLSYALLNTEDHHYLVRSHIVRLINLNPRVFSQYLLPVNQPTIEQQVKHMNRPSVWGTHLEVKAAATLFQVPVYFCTQSSPSGAFSWSVFHPIPPNSISFPVIVEEEFNNQERNVSPSTSLWCYCITREWENVCCTTSTYWQWGFTGDRLVTIINFMKASSNTLASNACKKSFLRIEVWPF